MDPEKKREEYQQVLKQAPYLLEEERDWIANLANTASHLYNQMSQVNWVGFYLYKEEQLVLGPFMGKPACVRIALGKGVCGTAAATLETQVVKDVHQFPGHIACDADSRSEIVIPMLRDGKLIGVLDIDSPILNRFDEQDRNALQEYVNILLNKTDWSPLTDLK